MTFAVFPKRTFIVAVILAALSLLLLAPALGRSSAQADGDIIPGKYIIIVNNGYDPQQIANDHGDATERVYRNATHGFSAKLSDRQVDELLSDPRVNNVVPDRYVYASAEGPTSLWSPPSRTRQLPLQRHCRRWRRLSRPECSAWVRLPPGEPASPAMASA